MNRVNTVQELFDLIPKYFRPEEAGNTQVTAQFDIHGDGGGQWFVQVAEGNLTVAEGAVLEHQFHVTASAQDCLNMANGHLNPLETYLSGRVQITGNLLMGYKLQSLFRIPSSLNGKI